MKSRPSHSRIERISSLFPVGVSHCGKPSRLAPGIEFQMLATSRRPIRPSNRPGVLTVLDAPEDILACSTSDMVTDHRAIGCRRQKGNRVASSRLNSLATGAGGRRAADHKMRISRQRLWLGVQHFLGGAIVVEYVASTPMVPEAERSRGPGRDCPSRLRACKPSKSVREPESGCRQRD